MASLGIVSKCEKATLACIFFSITFSTEELECLCLRFMCPLNLIHGDIYACNATGQSGAGLRASPGNELSLLQGMIFLLKIIGIPIICAGYHQDTLFCFFFFFNFY